MLGGKIFHAYLKDVFASLYGHINGCCECFQYDSIY